jgi:hypothetical protein
MKEDVRKLVIADGQELNKHRVWYGPKALCFPSPGHRPGYWAIRSFIFRPNGSTVRRPALETVSPLGRSRINTQQELTRVRRFPRALPWAGRTAAPAGQTNHILQMPPFVSICQPPQINTMGVPNCIHAKSAQNSLVGRNRLSISQMVITTPRNNEMSPIDRLMAAPREFRRYLKNNTNSSGTTKITEIMTIGVSIFLFFSLAGH